MLTPSRINEIEAKAQDVLAIAYPDGNITLPVKLGDVLKYYNLNLKSAKFDDPEAAGSFERVQKTILIAEDVPFPRMAFTVAHELGHFFLHERKKREVFWRMNELNIDKEDKEEEQEANWFAASLLMPKTKILEYWTVSRDIESLARIFGVSHSAMLWRLVNLGLLE